MDQLSRNVHNLHVNLLHGFVDVHALPGVRPTAQQGTIYVLHEIIEENYIAFILK